MFPCIKINQSPAQNKPVSTDTIGLHMIVTICSLDSFAKPQNNFILYSQKLFYYFLFCVLFLLLFFVFPFLIFGDQKGLEGGDIYIFHCYVQWKTPYIHWKTHIATAMYGIFKIFPTFENKITLCKKAKVFLVVSNQKIHL